MEKITLLRKKLVGDNKISFIIAGTNAYYTNDFFEKAFIIKGMPNEKPKKQHETHKGYWFEVEISSDFFNSVIDSIKKLSDEFYLVKEKFDLEYWDTSII